MSDTALDLRKFRLQNGAYENISYMMDVYRINWKLARIVPVMFFRESGAWIGVLGRRSVDAFAPDLMVISPETEDFKIQRIVTEAVERLSSLGLKKPVPALVSRGTPREDAGITEIVIRNDFSGLEFLRNGNGQQIPGSEDVFTVLPAHPVPFYHEEMTAYQKSLLLNRNMSLRPPISEGDLLISGTELGYARSIGRSRDFIKRDLADLLTDLTGSGTFLRRGGYLYYPYTEDEYRRRFLKRFVRYRDLKTKRTIFDFS